MTFTQSFAFVTYAQAICALRCFNILNNITVTAPAKSIDGLNSTDNNEQAVVDIKIKMTVKVLQFLFNIFIQLICAGQAGTKEAETLASISKVNN